jgi:hypothetical protein
MLLGSLLAACFPSRTSPATMAPADQFTTRPVDVRTQSMPLTTATPCSGTFVAHDLEHITTAALPIPRLFDSNGSGLAVNDLDDDGDQDIVLANLAGPAQILWNQGELRFTQETLPLVRRARAVAIVDVDGDAALDIVFTGGMTAPAVFRNLGNGAFELLPLPGVSHSAYAMNWNDLDQDGDLDLVTGAYDAARMVEAGSNALFAASPGVNVYLQGDGRWESRQLTTTAQALAIALWDLNGDGLPDIWVGNDFDDHDQVWLRNGDDWRTAAPFDDTTHSTMGIDRGDVDNDGMADYFATDMKPFALDPETLAGWLPLMDKAAAHRERGDPQVMENVLQHWRNGRFQNEAYERNVDAAGWSWSGKFGDLDNDGDLDLYVVNGMIAADLLEHLPGGELVEANQALRNDGRGQFAEAAAWGLGSLRSGRGMSMADFDGDGDLDIVVNNLNQPAQLFENRLCDLGDSLLVDLRWPASANPFAVGATAVLHTDRGRLLRDVRAVSGYLSGDPAQLHFGLAPGTTVAKLEIRWPDGAVATVDDPPLNRRLIVTR